ncbi:hypothetical protein [Nocardioides ultimimeridianus]
MRLSEQEMTAALTGAAQRALGARDKRVRRGKLTAAELWESMGRYERYVVLNGLGDQILPVLVALPDVEVAAGERPAFTDSQVTAAVEETLGGAGEKGLRRKALVVTRVALVKTALSALPPRQDPDGLIVPDHL